MQPSLCLNCHQTASLIFVHGHYQCSLCGMNTLPCCDGDNSCTNWLLQQQEDTDARIGNSAASNEATEILPLKNH